MGGAAGQLMEADASVLNRLSTDPATGEVLHNLMHPGLTMVLTDDPAPEASRSSRSFVIATHHEPEDWQTRVLRQ
jgi:hypothetical protein